jgi:hypothetical protein
VLTVWSGLSRTTRRASFARRRPTRPFGLAAANAAQDTEAAAAFSDRIQGCQNWRREYVDIMEDFAKLMLAASPAVQMCQAGLDAAKQAFVFRMNDMS